MTLIDLYTLQNSIKLKNYTNGSRTEIESGKLLDVLIVTTTRETTQTSLSSVKKVNKIVFALFGLVNFDAY